MKRIIAYASSAVMLLSSCGSSDEGFKKIEDIESTVDNDSTELVVNTMGVQEIIKAIPSPLEMTSSIKASGAEFSKDLLNNTDNADNYSTSYKKALNLGVYGADLGYINIYEKTRSSVNYLNSIKKLANDLKVGQFFEFETIKRLANTTQDLDSIMFVSTSGFEKMDNYLNEKKRSNLSILILAGGWIEALYIATQVADSRQESNADLIDRIGEQKIVLEDLKILLSMYENAPNFNTLIKDITVLQEAYKNVSIEYIEGESETKEVDGALMIVSTTESKVNITKQDVRQITDVVADLRETIIK